MVAFVIGALLPDALRAKGTRTQIPMRAIFGSLMLLVIAQACLGVWLFLVQGGLPDFFGGISDHKANITYVSTIALSMLLADATARVPQSGMIGLPRWAQVASFAILVVTTYMSGARNGIIVVLFLFVLWAPFFLIHVLSVSRRTMLLAALGLALCIGAASWVMIKIDDRWSRLIATVPIALNVQADQSWLDIQKIGLPLAVDGKPVEANAYERIAWARVAELLLLKYPFGIGVTKEAFRERVEMDFGPTRAAHAHNGYLDLGLAIGVPGLLLWVAFLILLLRQGITLLNRGQLSSIALVLLVVSFALRSALDSVIRDHILEQFMFFSALFLAVTVSDRKVS
jgi:O-antigen ligase